MDEELEEEESESDLDERLGGAEGLLVIEYSGRVLVGGVCERETEMEDEEANGWTRRDKRSDSRSEVSAGDSASGENAPGTVRRVGFGAANVTEESEGEFVVEESRDVELLEAALDLEVDDLGADSGIVSDCLDGGAFLTNLPDESLGWDFDEDAFDCLDMQLATNGDREVNRSRS